MATDRRIRQEVWLENPYCHECGCLTVMVTAIQWSEKHSRFIPAPGGPFPPTMATSKGIPDPKRPPHGKIVILCHRCRSLALRAKTLSAWELYDPETLIATPPSHLNGGQRNRQKRLKLWLEDPHCRFCGRLTVLVTPVAYIPQLGLFAPSRSYPDNSATLEHVYSRYNPKRQTERGLLTLSCLRCNQANAQRDIELYSSLEDQRARAGRSA